MQLAALSHNFRELKKFFNLLISINFVLISTQKTKFSMAYCSDIICFFFLRPSTCTTWQSWTAHCAKLTWSVSAVGKMVTRPGNASSPAAISRKLSSVQAAAVWAIWPAIVNRSVRERFSTRSPAEARTRKRSTQNTRRSSTTWERHLETKRRYHFFDYCYVSSEANF